jgi:hypothetical protein
MGCREIQEKISTGFNLLLLFDNATISCQFQTFAKNSNPVSMRIETTTLLSS